MKRGARNGCCPGMDIPARYVAQWCVVPPVDLLHSHQNIREARGARRRTQPANSTKHVCCPTASPPSTGPASRRRPSCYDCFTCLWDQCDLAVNPSPCSNGAPCHSSGVIDPLSCFDHPLQLGIMITVTTFITAMRLLMNTPSIRTRIR